MSLFGGNYGYGGGSSRPGMSWRFLIGVGIALVGLISYFGHKSRNPVTGEMQHVSMTPGQEIALGLQSAPEMEQQMGGLVPESDPEAKVVIYVGQRIWHNSDASKSPYPYAYHLLNDTKTINAFALPGGQVFITRALLEKLQWEAELAGVLGHETGHVVMRHSAQQVEKSQLGQTLVLGTGVAASDRQNGYMTAAAAAAANQLLQLHFSRADETQADECGVRFMAQAGYDPRAMEDVMKVLMATTQTNGQPPALFQTHPHPEDRLQHIDALIKQLWPNGVPADLTMGHRLASYRGSESSAE